MGRKKVFESLFKMSVFGWPMHVKSSAWLDRVIGQLVGMICDHHLGWVVVCVKHDGWVVKDASRQTHHHSHKFTQSPTD
jgi:hypothetical protein